MKFDIDKDSRERVIRAIKFEKVDRIPIIHSFLFSAILKHKEKFIELLKKYPNDFGTSDYKIVTEEDLKPWDRKGIYTDEWGCVWRNEQTGMLGQVIEHPLDTLDKLRAYKFPERSNTFLTQKEDIDKRKKDYFTILGPNISCPGGYFEKLQFLRGYENLMFDLLEGSKEFEVFADKLLEYFLCGIEDALKLEPDAVAFGDDWGTQKQLIINPKIWMEFFKPRYKKMFDLVHSKNVYVRFHSDGYIKEIIPDLIEIGVNILNPQFSCFDLDELVKLTKNKVCIESDIDRQYILPRGTVEEVKNYVRLVLEKFDAKNGGFIGKGEASMDTQLENLEAMYQTFLEE